MEAQIQPETVMLGPGGNVEVLCLIDEWMVGAGPDKGFTIDAARDRVQVCVGGGLDPETAKSEVEAWIDEFNPTNTRPLNVNRWSSEIEVRNRLDANFEKDGFKADLQANGRDYIIHGPNDVKVGSLELTPDGWIGLSESMTTNLDRHRTAPHSNPQAALQVLIRNQRYVND